MKNWIAMFTTQKCFKGLMSLCFISLFIPGYAAREQQNLPFLKTKADNATYKTITLDHLTVEKTPDKNLCPLGGLSSKTHKATGFFRVEKNDGVWSLIDPHGHPFFCMAVNSLASSQKDGHDVNEMMTRLGFNTYGCWSDLEVLANYKRPYCIKLNFIVTFAQQLKHVTSGYGHFDFKNNTMPVFHKEFEEFVYKNAQTLIQLQNDPLLLGVFSDNELPFNASQGCISRYLSLAGGDPGRVAAENYMSSRGISQPELRPEHDAEFFGQVIERYFSLVSKALKMTLPHHLYLGTRFHGRALAFDPLMSIAGKYVDVISINYYHRWTPEYETIKKWEKLANRPLMVTEFYAKAKDSGLNNSKGAGFLVETQKDRADFYQNYCIGLLRNPNIVGWHYFRYTDDTKRGQESNKGILNKDHEPYEELVKAMSQLNKSCYTLREQLLLMKSPFLLDGPEIYY